MALKYPENEKLCTTYLNTEHQITHILTRPPRSDDFLMYKINDETFEYLGTGTNPLELEAEFIQDDRGPTIVGGEVKTKTRKKSDANE